MCKNISQGMCNPPGPGLDVGNINSQSGILHNYPQIMTLVMDSIVVRLLSHGQGTRKIVLQIVNINKIPYPQNNELLGFIPKLLNSIN